MTSDITYIQGAEKTYKNGSATFLSLVSSDITYIIYVKKVDKIREILFTRPALDLKKVDLLLISVHIRMIAFNVGTISPTIFMRLKEAASSLDCKIMQKITSPHNYLMGSYSTSPSV